MTGTTSDVTAGTTAGPSRPAPDDDLTLALALADAADTIGMARFGAADLRVDSKPDMTPVTDADREVERTLRKILATRRPDDAVVGEEFGDGVPPGERAAHGRCWVIDPIDGTKNYVRGVPIWATLIALLVDGVPRVGVVSAPALVRRWWGSPRRDGPGAFTAFGGGEPRACRVSGVTRIEDASLSIAQPEAWEEAGRGEQARDLGRRSWRTRGYGDFYSYMLLAEGAVDVAGEPELSLWDLAALAPIVIAAGGSFTDVDGAPIGPGSTSALATNGALQDAVRRALALR